MKETNEGNKLKSIGTVAVDSGRICIIDPCYKEEVTSQAEEGEIKASANKNVELGVIFGTEIGDGTFPIYEKRNPDGHLTEVIIKLSEARYYF